jgi:hypothetical protein
MGAGRRVGDAWRMSTFMQTEAERACGRASRARRRAAVLCRMRRRACDCCERLAVARDAAGRRRGPRDVREIPLSEITGTLEPNRAEHFDREFRPAPITRERWKRVWLAEARGAVLPPISVVPAGDGYAVRDGHHRVSVALARGAVMIDAVVAVA